MALYIKAMQKSGFTDKSPVYVASGIFSAWEPHSEWGQELVVKVLLPQSCRRAAGVQECPLLLVGMMDVQAVPVCVLWHAIATGLFLYVQLVKRLGWASTAALSHSLLPTSLQGLLRWRSGSRTAG